MNINIRTREHEYTIYIEELGEIRVSGKVLVVTNPRVCGLHIAKMLSKIKADDVFVCTIKDGENYKNMRSIEEILHNAFIHKLDRKSTIVAFGGGVIGDMAGFAAGIYQRGIDFIQVPTTLLSQVDASVGGKTGINNEFGKNLVGIFHQPKSVHIDTDFLSTLPKREFISGISEIVKMAVCFDKDFFAWLENADLCGNKAHLQEAIARSVEIKARVVSQDEKEEGIRAGLNYGHTFAHVVELFGNYKTYLHGEAVSIGMCKANVLALLLGKLSNEESHRIQNLLQKFGLPVEYRANDKEEFYEHFFLDKKSRHNELRFIIPCGIGAMEIVSNPPKDMLLKAL